MGYVARVMSMSDTPARAPTWPGYVALVVPFAIIVVRLASVSGHVYLPDDLALIDLDVRGAMHFSQQLGPFDRFGWNHPGPVFFYLISIVARVLGTGARAMYVSAALINLASAIATVAVVRRRAGTRAALFASVCCCGLAVALSTTNPGAVTFSEGALGAVVSPWNPDVVIFPLLCFCVLAGSAAAGSPRSLLGAGLAATFVVQTNIATLPLVAVLALVATVACLTGIVADRRRLIRSDGRPRRPADRIGSIGGRRVPWSVVAAVVLLVAAWLPPVVQQLSGHPGNLTLIWRFFTERHTPLSLGIGLWSVLAVDAVFVSGLAQEMTFVLGAPHSHAWLVLAGVLLLGLVGAGLGLARRSRFAAALGAGSLIGLGTAIVSVTRVVGPVYGYLILWAIVLPVVAAIGVGAAVLAPAPSKARPADHTPAHGRAPSRARALAGWLDPARARPSGRPATVVLGLLALGAGAVLSLQMVRQPSLQSASDPNVAAAWKAVAAHLRPGPSGVFVGDAGTSIEGLFTFFGLVNELDSHGYSPRVSPFWRTQVGPRYVSDGREPVQVVLYPPSPAVRSMQGFVGQTQYADVVIIHSPPGP